MNEYEEMKAELARQFRDGDVSDRPEPLLDKDGYDMTAFWYGKKMPYTPKPGVAESNRKRTGDKGGNWKGGLCDDRRAYLTVKAREYRHAKYGPPSRGPYAN